MSDGTDPATPLGDDELLAALGRAVGVHDPAPPLLRDAAVRALTWDLDRAGLAELVFDSDRVAGGMRSVEADVRDLVFELDDVTVELTVEPVDDTTARVTGVVVGVAVDQVLVRRPGDTDLAAAVDAHGRFALELGGSVAAVLVRATPDRLVRTPLFSLVT